MNIPYHCDPENIAALLKRLEALEDPMQEACPPFEDTDWRTTAGICARVIRFLSMEQTKYKDFFSERHAEIMENAAKAIRKRLLEDKG